MNTDKSYENGIGVWTFESYETDWIAAKTRQEAVNYYSKYIKPEPGSFKISQVWDLDAKELVDYDKVIGYEEGYPIFKKISYRELIERAEGGFPLFIASTVY